VCGEALSAAEAPGSGNRTASRRFLISFRLSLTVTLRAITSWWWKEVKRAWMVKKEISELCVWTGRERGKDDIMEEKDAGEEGECCSDE